MEQILFNWLMVFILPAVAGLLLRLLLFRVRKGWWMTLGLVVLAAASSLLFYVAPSFGTEAHGILTAQLYCGAAGALLAEVMLRLRKQ